MGPWLSKCTWSALFGEKSPGQELWTTHKESPVEAQLWSLRAVSEKLDVSE